MRELDGRYAIQLFRGANLSTISHEITHAVYLEMERLEFEGLATPDLRFAVYHNTVQFVGRAGRERGAAAERLSVCEEEVGEEELGEFLRLPCQPFTA